jgi:uncharacterized protein
MLLHTDDALRAILEAPRRMAVLGAKEGRFEAAWYVPAYLRELGWSIVGVNPRLAGQDWLGAPAVATLAGLQGAVDVIEVFRRPDLLVPHAHEILALPWRPRWVWFQLGIANAEAAGLLAAAGIGVVQDRCMMPEHRRLVR